jgi:hypothetical protein
MRSRTRWKIEDLKHYLLTNILRPAEILHYDVFEAWKLEYTPKLHF